MNEMVSLGVLTTYLQMTSGLLNDMLVYSMTCWFIQCCRSNEWPVSMIGARGRSILMNLILPGIPRLIRWSSKECVHWGWVTSLPCLNVIGPRICGLNGHRRPSMKTTMRNLRSIDIHPHKRAQGNVLDDQTPTPYIPPPYAPMMQLVYG